MQNVRNSILATLVYYDILNFPLTFSEVHKYLINPSRLSLANKPIGDLRPNEIKLELDDLVRLKLIFFTNGYYTVRHPMSDIVPNTIAQELSDLRIERFKIAEEKWRKFLKVGELIQAVPYVRGVFASGSMAMNNTDEDSDFDVLMIIKPGRLYTSRLLLLSLTSLMRSRRRWFDKTAPDKLCFNHYLAEDALHISHHSLYNAQSYAHLVPTLVSRALFDNFFHENKWINKYLFNFRPGYDRTRRSIKKNFFLLSIAKTLEFMLNTKFGDLFERLARSYQQRRIKNNPDTYNSGGRIVFNDKELEFHPNSFEKSLIGKYNETIKEFGIIAPSEEKDSGLQS